MATKTKKSSGSAAGKAGTSQSAKVSRTPPGKSVSPAEKPAPPVTAKKPVVKLSGSPTKTEFIQVLDKLKGAKSVSEVTSSKKKLIEMIKKAKPTK